MNHPAEITNMVMIENPETGEVLVQHRRLYWTGISFPGGHVEDGESFVDSAVREVQEETGLLVKNLHLCGVIHWFHTQKKERYMVLLYKTTDFSGQLFPETEEGEVFWVSKEKLPEMDLSPHFDSYLKVFLNEDKNEAFANWNEQDSGTLRIE